MKITAENIETGRIKTLAQPRTLKAAAARLRKDGPLWAQRWEAILLEDVSEEDLKAALRRGDINFKDFKELRSQL